MRLVPLAALLALAAPLAAQTPDPTPPTAYYPLGLGDVREYRESGNVMPTTYERQTVVVDTLVGGVAYRLVETESFQSDGTFVGRYRAAFRFDDALATVVYQPLAGSPYAVTPCRFDLPFTDGGGYAGCDGGLYFGVASATVALNGATVDTSIKGFSGTFGDVAYAAGLGLVELNYDANERVRVLRYARIGGVAYGTPDPILPPLSSGGGPVASALALSAGPNPTAGPLTLALTLASPTAVVVEAFDALGRRVHRSSATFGAGAQTLGVDTSRWRAGLYVVRATAGEASATVRIVRR